MISHMKIFSSTEDWFVYTNSLFILLVQTSRSSHIFYRMRCNQRHKIVPWSKHRQTKHRRYFFTENSVNVFFVATTFIGTIYSNIYSVEKTYLIPTASCLLGVTRSQEAWERGGINPCLFVRSYFCIINLVPKPNT